MKQIKFYGKRILFFFLVSIIVTLLLSILEYFKLFHPKTITILLKLIEVILFFLLGIDSGKHTKKKGYIAGIKMGGFLLIFRFIGSIIFKKISFSFFRLSYGFLLLMSSIAGAMLGINKKKE